MKSKDSVLTAYVEIQFKAEPALAWWCTLVSLALMGLNQEGCHEFKAYLNECHTWKGSKSQPFSKAQLRLRLPLLSKHPQCRSSNLKQPDREIPLRKSPRVSVRSKTVRTDSAGAAVKDSVCPWRSGTLEVPCQLSNPSMALSSRPVACNP